MPKCFACRGPVPGDELRPFGENNRGWPEDELGCSSCRRKRLTHTAAGMAANKRKKEVTMSKERKPIASIQVIPAVDDGNYNIIGYVRIGGMKLELDTDVDRIRSFFTKRRERRALEVKKTKRVVEGLQRTAGEN